MKIIEDRVTDLFIMLDSTIDTVTSLNEVYLCFRQHRESVDISTIATDPIAYGFHQKHRELLLIKQKAEALHKRVQGTVQLVSNLDACS